HASTKGVLPLPALSALFFVSGFAALLYQVLWQKQLGYLLGSGAYATATTLAVFFLGLTLGQFAGGRFAAQCRDPLRAYALLELGIAASAASFFVLAPIMREVYPGLFRAVGGFPWLLGGAQAL